MKHIYSRSELLTKFIFVLYSLFVIKDFFPIRDTLGFFLNAIVVLLFIGILFSESSTEFNYTKKKNILSFILVSLSLLFLLSQYHHVPFNSYFLFYRRLLTPFLFYPILSYLNHIPIKQFKIYFSILVVIQIFMAFSQYFNIFPFLSLPSSVPDLESRFSGTFPNNNYLGNFLALVGVVILIELITKRFFGGKRLRSILIISEIIVCISVLLTGVRTSFVTLFIGLLLTFLLFSVKKNLLKKLIISISVFLILSYVLYNSENSAIARIREGTVDLINEGGNIEDSQSTIALTIRLFNLMDHDMFLGQGMLFKTGYAVANSWDSFIAISEENNNITDATLAIILIEFGLLGFIIFLAPAIFTWRNCKVMKKESFILFFVMFLQTFFDLGLFNFFQLVFVLLYLKTKNVDIIN